MAQKDKLIHFMMNNKLINVFQMNLFKSLTIAVIILSCNIKVNVPIISEFTKSVKCIDSQLITNDSLLGEWGIYSTVRGNLYSKCFTCPKIVFGNDGKALILLPSKEKEIISWKLENDTLLVSDNLDGNYFQDPKYVIKFEQKKNYIELRINNFKDFSYILRR